MEAMRQSWSDDRLDDLNKRVDELRRRMDARFAQIDARWIARLDASIARKIDASAHGTPPANESGLDQVNARFDAMQQTMMRIGAGLIGVLIASSAGLIATQL